VSGAFTPLLAKLTKSFNLIDMLSVGVDRIQRNFEPMRRHVESWRQTQITDAELKLVTYTAFVGGEVEAPRSLLPDVHRSRGHPMARIIVFYIPEKFRFTRPLPV